MITTKNYSTFKLRVFVIAWCVVPNLPSTRTRSFKSFGVSARFYCKFEKILKTGNFEMIHDPDNEVANKSKSLLDSFGLTQSVDEPALEFRHTLNLIVSHGLSQGTSGHLLCVLDCADPPLADVGALLPG